MLRERLHPGRQSYERGRGVGDGRRGYACYDWAGHFAESGLREAGEDGRALRDVLENFTDQGGGVDVFEEGIVGGACVGR